MCWLLKMTKIVKFYLELIDYKLAYIHQAVVTPLFFQRKKEVFKFVSTYLRIFYCLAYYFAGYCFGNYHVI